MKIPHFWRVAAVAVPVVAGLLSPVASAQAVTTTKTHLQYIVSPHPDDVFMGWALVQDSQANYPVFITLTQGESTGACKAPNNTAISVDYWGSFNRGTPAGCKGARMASLNNWFDDQSNADPYLNDYVKAENTALGYNMVKHVETAPMAGSDTGFPKVSGMVGCSPAWSTGGCTGTNSNIGAVVPNNLNPGSGITAAQKVTWYVGSTSARVEFDLGDGNLTNDEVSWAMNYVRANRAAKLPLTQEYGVVAAGYSNLKRQYSACTDYSHHDHRALQETVYDRDLIPDAGYHPQWGATCGSQTTTTGIDTESLPVNGGRANMITDAHYNENMSGTSGYFQNRFRWLAGGGPWASGADPTHPVIFAKWNYFWRSH